MSQGLNNSILQDHGHYGQIVAKHIRPTHRSSVGFQHRLTAAVEKNDNVCCWIRHFRTEIIEFLMVNLGSIDHKECYLTIKPHKDWNNNSLIHIKWHFFCPLSYHSFSIKEFESLCSSLAQLHSEKYCKAIDTFIFGYESLSQHAQCFKLPCRIVILFPRMVLTNL